eukprot:TRINITY_DN11750_c0_g1_i1.p1 TRINITY_DN11750_c0_g1~~TRINITY_DN11750_c0_g1_i1.p1  ORF type:complete len:487 (+),score=107.48 TRINITY_DN11750_c0_g1_i1:147-1607(+)
MRVKKFTVAVITFLVVNVYFFLVWVTPDLKGTTDFRSHMEDHLGGKRKFAVDERSGAGPRPGAPARTTTTSSLYNVSPISPPPPVSPPGPSAKRIAVPLPGSAKVSRLQTKSARLVRDDDGHPSLERRQAPVQRTDVVIGIMTAHKNRAVRDGNRASFLKLATPGIHKGVTWTYRFILGNIANKTLFDECVEENKKHGDMVFFDFVDSYQNLTLKTSMGIAYFLENYEFGYFVKLDDDSYLQLDLLLDASRSFRKHAFAWGFVGGKMNPDRGEGDKWYVPYSEWPGNRTFVPDYNVMHGPCYVLGYDVCEFVYRRTQEPDYIPIRLEDCNMSLLLVEGGYVPVGDHFFIVGDCTPDGSPEWFSCALSKHWCTPDTMKAQYDVYQKRLQMFPDSPNCIWLQPEATDPQLHAQTRYNNIMHLQSQYHVTYVNGKFVASDSAEARNAPPLELASLLVTGSTPAVPAVQPTPLLSPVGLTGAPNVVGTPL